ncbi:Uncharacterised protein [uncultured archaeon]|nr:Uncharacterised protein [uncultured archaeon]
MNLKCIECDKDAEYIFNGNSYCKTHFPKKESKEESKIKQFLSVSTGVGGGTRV